jgi:hypothetical protein
LESERLAQSVGRLAEQLVSLEGVGFGGQEFYQAQVIEGAVPEVRIE